MKQFRSIFRFEYTGHLKSKVFQVVTILGVLLVLVATTIPTITKMVQKGEGTSSSTSVKEGEKDKILLSDATGIYGDQAALEAAFPDQYEFTVEKNKSVDEVKKLVEKNEVKLAFVVEAPQKITLVQKQQSMDGAASQFRSYFTYRMQAAQLAQLGVTPENSAAVLGAQVELSEVQTGGKNFAQSAILAYILIMLLYMSIIMYGNMVASSVAGEKTSRAMEVLITYARPKNLMFGKVMAAGCAGLTQLGLILAAAVAGYLFNRSSYSGMEFVETLVKQSVEPLIYMFVFYILGFFIYAFLFGAVGSLANRLEDINTTSMPVVLLLVAAFFIGITGMMNPDSMLVTVTSFVPFLSPVVMFARICMTKVDLIQILISIAINLVALVGVGIFSGKIYQMGVLMYGTPPKLKNIFKMLREKQS